MNTPSVSTEGRSIALCGDTGSGKTTLIGDFAKHRYKTLGRRLRYFRGDLGGSESIQPLIRVGIIEEIPFIPEIDNPWIWADNAANGRDRDGRELPPDTDVAYDSGTNICESILNAITKENFQIGQQKTQKFVVAKGEQSLSVGINNEAHYGLVQGFGRDVIWKSTWLTRRGADVIWTFGLDRKEKADSTPVLGPMLVGHALTALLPKWFKYTFRVAEIPVSGAPSRHLLYLQAQPEIGGLGMSISNSRYPLDATTPLPAVVEPASLAEAFTLIERGQQEAEAALRAELGL
jgi:hypothetical protein